ncbi:phage-shock protein [Photobacterium angustum]|nr:phage-shock protein [Photobacterium angustum]
MFEFLFLLTFALVLVFTGVSIIGMMIAVAAGFAIMAVVGMLGLVIKLLPWIVLIAIAIWLVRDNKKSTRIQRSSISYTSLLIC